MQVVVDECFGTCQTYEADCERNYYNVSIGESLTHVVAHVFRLGISNFYKRDSWNESYWNVENENPPTPNRACYLYFLRDRSGTGAGLAMEGQLSARDRIGVQDFVLLEDYMSETAFVDNLQKRFKENLIYVRRSFMTHMLPYDKTIGCNLVTIVFSIYCWTYGWCVLTCCRRILARYWCRWTRTRVCRSTRQKPASSTAKHTFSRCLPTCEYIRPLDLGPKLNIEHN
jgi:hypothetical protein